MRKQIVHANVKRDTYIIHKIAWCLVIFQARRGHSRQHVLVHTYQKVYRNKTCQISATRPQKVQKRGKLHTNEGFSVESSFLPPHPHTWKTTLEERSTSEEKYGSLKIISFPHALCSKLTQEQLKMSGGIAQTKCLNYAKGWKGNGMLMLDFLACIVKTI